MKSYFVKNLPSAVAEVMSTFGLAVEIKIPQHRKDEKAYAADDIILLFQIIDLCTVFAPLDIPSLASKIQEVVSSLKIDGLLL